MHITPQEMIVLILLDRGARTMSEIQARSALGRTTVYKAMKALKGAGLVEQNPAEGDGPRQIRKITQLGREVLNGI